MRDRSVTSRQSAAFSPDGTRVVTASDDGTAQVWDAATSSPLGLPLEHQEEVYRAEFSPDGMRVVTDATRAQLARLLAAPVPSHSNPPR